MAQTNGPTANNDTATVELARGENEVIERLSSYENPEVTSELYDFGSILLRDATDRTNWLDTKAGLFAGFSGAMIVVVISTFSSWKELAKDWPSASICLFFGLITLLTAAFLAIRGLHARKFEWLDEKDLWFAKEYFNHPDQLRRYYLIGMYRAVVSHDEINGQKAKILTRAELLLVAGAFLLALPLLLETWQLGVGCALASLLDYFRRWGL